MKKVIFTAFTVVAFCGVSFAKTSKNVKNKQTAKEILVIADCGAFASYMMAAYEELNECLNSADYNAGYHYFKAICEI
ncbi:hypothetical protein [Flavobacterium phragmitis]|uniref:Uncharacterized protein n=1 Tax=Flavobacterium phragmitis TaxID=739143 RepID=A0A1I1QTW1_9FLAO|nr:hypothetical protein [Flavobacterium phragmitis]SFD25551.1 hypothetical protein SAMN05216297_10666 [Flavobacterium phragmitis]